MNIKMKRKEIPNAFIIAAISILLIQILFFSVLYFYPNEYTLPVPHLRKISYTEWNWYVAQPGANIYDSTLLQICLWSQELTLTMWILNLYHIKSARFGLFAKILLFLVSVLALAIPALLMNFYVVHCTLSMTLWSLELLSLLLLVILIVRFKTEQHFMKS